MLAEVAGKKQADRAVTAKLKDHKAMLAKLLPRTTDWAPGWMRFPATVPNPCTARRRARRSAGAAVLFRGHTHDRPYDPYPPPQRHDPHPARNRQRLLGDDAGRGRIADFR